MENLQHPMSTDSFSQNWLLNKYAPFEFSYIRSKSEEAAEWDDHSSVGVGSFNFGTQSPHWFQFDSANDLLYADELFFDGFIKATTVLSPAASIERCSSSTTERKSLFVVKCEESSVSSPAVIALRCRFLGKWGRNAKKVVIKCWKVFKCSLKSTRKNKTMCGGHSYWPSGRSGLNSYGNGSVENPIYEAILHCKRSNGAS